MAGTNAPRAGGCLCGALRFEARGAPKWVAHCHCASCRRATGSPFTTFAGFRREDVTFLGGEPRRRRSSPGVTRGFCAECGTPLSYESERWPDEVHLYVCSFDAPAAFSPQAHVNMADSLTWLRLADDLPRHDRFQSG